VVDQLLADDEFTQLGGERRIVTVLFADLRNFTQWAEIHPPERVIERLNDMLERATDIL
jgi:adenylate cyclase